MQRCKVAMRHTPIYIDRFSPILFDNTIISKHGVNLTTRHSIRTGISSFLQRAASFPFNAQSKLCLDAQIVKRLQSLELRISLNVEAHRYSFNMEAHCALLCLQALSEVLGSCMNSARLFDENGMPQNPVSLAVKRWSGKRVRARQILKKFDIAEKAARTRYIPTHTLRQGSHAMPQPLHLMNCHFFRMRRDPDRVSEPMMSLVDCWLKCAGVEVTNLSLRAVRCVISPKP